MTKQNRNIPTITKRQTFRAYSNCVPRILSFGPRNERGGVCVTWISRFLLTAKYVTRRIGIGPLRRPKNKNEARDRLYLLLVCGIFTLATQEFSYLRLKTKNDANENNAGARLHIHKWRKHKSMSRRELFARAWSRHQLPLVDTEQGSWVKEIFLQKSGLKLSDWWRCLLFILTFMALLFSIWHDSM